MGLRAGTALGTHGLCECHVSVHVGLMPLKIVGMVCANAFGRICVCMLCGSINTWYICILCVYVCWGRMWYGECMHIVCVPMCVHEVWRAGVCACDVSVECGCL